MNYDRDTIKSLFDTFKEEDNIYTTNYIIAETLNRITQLINKYNYTFDDLNKFWTDIINYLYIIHLEEDYISSAVDLLISDNFKD